jgi:transaldolase
LEAQLYYKEHNFKTQVLPASLTSTAEIMSLSGVQHITISPALLEELATTPASSLGTASLFDQTATTIEPHPLLSFANDEAAFRIALTRRNNGEGDRKLGQVRSNSSGRQEKANYPKAITIFCDMQAKLEAMMFEAESTAQR